MCIGSQCVLPRGVSGAAERTWGAKIGRVSGKQWILGAPHSTQIHSGDPIWRLHPSRDGVWAGWNPTVRSTSSCPVGAAEVRGRGPFIGQRPGAAGSDTRGGLSQRRRPGAELDGWGGASFREGGTGSRLIGQTPWRGGTRCRGGGTWDWGKAGLGSGGAGLEGACQGGAEVGPRGGALPRGGGLTRGGFELRGWGGARG